MGNGEFILKAKDMVSKYLGIEEDEVVVVWYSKVYQNNTGFFITNLRGEYSFVVTYNGVNDAFYLDVYKTEVTIKNSTVESYCKKEQIIYSNLGYKSFENMIDDITKLNSETIKPLALEP